MAGKQLERRCVQVLVAGQRRLYHIIHGEQGEEGHHNQVNVDEDDRQIREETPPKNPCSALCALPFVFHSCSTRYCYGSSALGFEYPTRDLFAHARTSLLCVPSARARKVSAPRTMKMVIANAAIAP